MKYQEYVEKEQKEIKSKKGRSFLGELFSYVVMIAAVTAGIILLDTFIVINAVIPSSSMEPTISAGDRIFGYRLAYINKDPQRYDIVIFKYPDDESTLFIKRIIGLPGETVQIKDGKVYINGSNAALDDSFVAEEPLGDYGPYVVPEDSYFMLGDNRNYSKDSRFWQNKFVARDKIVGKAFLRYWPFTKFGGIG